MATTRATYLRGDCLSLIGMPGSGKSALGRTLSALTGLAHLDTDALIEAHYGIRLQAVTDAFDKKTFLDLEGNIVRTLNAARAVVSTGGSVVYRTEAMQRLHELGPVIHIDVPLDVLMERLAKAPDRGIAFGPGETVEDLFRERLPLYGREADIVFRPAALSLEQNAQALHDLLLQSGWEMPGQNTDLPTFGPHRQATR